ALRIRNLDGPVRLVLDVALADFLAQADQVLFLAPFVHHEEYVDLVERIDGLHGDVVGIAGANTDDENLSHLQDSSTHQHRTTFSSKDILPKPRFDAPTAINHTQQFLLPSRFDQDVRGPRATSSPM